MFIETCHLSDIFYGRPKRAVNAYGEWKESDESALYIFITCMYILKPNVNSPPFKKSKGQVVLARTYQSSSFDSL
jgi:hypothetical protein